MPIPSTTRCRSTALILCVWLACVTGSAWKTAAQERITDPDWSRHFRVGIQVGLNMKVDFSMGGQFAISGSQPGPAGVTGQDHRYDDGYVLVDDTGDNVLGATSYWGYQDASQYDSANHTLTFHSANSFSAASSGSAENAPYLGFDMAYGVNVWHWKRAVVGVDLGFGLLPITVQDTRTISGNFTRAVHQYNTTNNIVIPTAPYNGGPSGVGVNIVNFATALPDEVTGGTITGSRTLDATLYTMRLGPTLQWEVHPRIALAFSGGFAIGLLSGDYKFDETLLLSDGSSSINKGTISGTDMTYGGYINAAILVHVEPNADLYFAAQFMPMGDVGISSQGRQAQLSPGHGIFFAAGINWPF